MLFVSVSVMETIRTPVMVSVVCFFINISQILHTNLDTIMLIFQHSIQTFAGDNKINILCNLMARITDVHSQGFVP